MSEKATFIQRVIKIYSDGLKYKVCFYNQYISSIYVYILLIYTTIYFIHTIFIYTTIIYYFYYFSTAATDMEKA